MVDAGAGVGDLVDRRADPVGQHLGRALHAVAQAGDLDVRLALHGAAEHGHRVGVVEQDRVGAVAAPCPGTMSSMTGIVRRARKMPLTGRACRRR